MTLVDGGTTSKKMGNVRKVTGSEGKVTSVLSDCIRVCGICMPKTWERDPEGRFR